MCMDLKLGVNMDKIAQKIIYKNGLGKIGKTLWGKVLRSLSPFIYPFVLPARVRAHEPNFSQTHTNQNFKTQNLLAYANSRFPQLTPAGRP